jgi:two-component system, chemotaxis family, sensor kinase CheA
MMLSQDDLLKVFVEEALEHLSAIENDFLALEKAGEVFDPDLVNRVFRAAHSIKGGAGFIGLNNIKELSHKMETVLGRIRKEKRPPDAETINCLILASDALKNLVANVETSDSIDISMPMKTLNAIGVERPAPQRKQIRPDPEAILRQHPVQEMFSKMAIPENDVLQARNEGKTIYVLRMDAILDVRINGRSNAEIIDDIKSYTTFLSSRTESVRNAGTEGVDSGRPLLFVAFACVLSLDDVSLLLDVSRENLFQVDEVAAYVSPKEGDSASYGFKDPETTRKFTVRGPAELEPGASELNNESSQAAVISGFASDVRDALLPRVENQTFNEILPTSIRVSIHLLDSLMNLAGELVLSRNQLLKAITVKDQNNTEIVGKRVDSITTDLQKVIMLTRMQPVGSLFNRFPRIVRNLSRELGKETELVIEGADVELDRTLIEAMSDPLNHLIRNAVDHGIEIADVRKRSGKFEMGKIILRAFNEAGQVVIEVSDDGAGIDPEKMAAAAISKGFVSEDQVRIMEDKDKLNLIFLPGFSTARTISDLSGRGVGMDVVKTNLDNLGGLIELVSCPGTGTRIKIKLPLTLAIIPSQIISTEGERFAIPQMNLEELLRIPAGSVKDRIERVGDAEVVRLRGKLLPLVRLTDVLKVARTYIDPETGQRRTDRRRSLSDRRSRKSPLYADDSDQQSVMSQPGGAEAPLFLSPALAASGASAVSLCRKTSDRRQRATSALNIAVVSTGRIRYGLIVETFHDSEEIVVKPLGRHLKTCRGYAGATIMGDGRVALILDVNSLSEMAGLFSVSGTRRAVEVAKAAEKAIRPDADQLNLIVFRNAEDEQFALPLNQVLRIEKIMQCDIRSFGSIRAIQYRGGNLPVFSIDQVACVQPLAARDHLLVIVFMVAGRELGLLAIGPVDSMMTHAGADADALKQSGIMGSVILNGKTTLLVDIFDLVRSLQPDWFSAASSPELEIMKSKTILVADDSNFFRSQVKSFIQHAGYTVVDAEDGEAAWQILQKSGHNISLVVTDMEMPRLNGFELTETIRKDERFSRMPIIALTTLADDKDMERAKRAGVDEYQIKLDKEKLLDSIRALIHEHGRNAYSRSAYSGG